MDNGYKSSLQIVFSERLLSEKRESKHRALTYIFHDQTAGIGT